MAKTNKTSKKTSNSKKSRFSFLNPNTAKKRLLMILLIFAVIGGGVLAYRSYAATGYGDYTVYQFDGYDGAYLADAPGKKRNSKVLWLRPGSQVKLAPRFEPVIFASYVRACAYVSNSDLFQGAKVVVFVIESEGGGSGSFHNINSFGFNKLCSKYVDHRGMPNSKLGIQVHNHISNSNQILVSGASLEYSDSGQN